ncbi:MAG: sn-glycerol-3-phosphate ABC transporter ATP-binding protein UgpC [Cyanobacteria bacterium NC_groundwater_1444_Ag_S-0.65um_54_12]|nr:sn-glycerol-3-phosphate ABC transporter ATP-binding protein UgpC [Cyanobacteria bacterium NC_groundwater_1444_Ag_S-0.65um_54_12]
MARVVFDRARKQYSENVVIHDLSLTIDDSEFMVLVGPSGCGKSTALRMIAGLEEISDGFISIGDRVVNDLHPKQRDIAMVFQNYALYPHMSVFDNMAFALKLRKIPKSEIERRVREAARALEIERLLDRKPKALSGGQRQRVAIGRAIVREPKVFLMDEPLSNLDAKLRVSMRAEIKKLHRKLQTTFIYVTHDQIEAMTLGDRIAILNGGKLQQCGTPHQVYAEPANLFVATFIGSPQMNLLDAELKSSSTVTMITGPDFCFTLPQRADYSAGDVKVGLRPEHLVCIADPNPQHALTAQVEVVEPLGAESYLYLSGKMGNLVARVAAEQTPQVGEAITLTIDAGKLHLFDPRTETRLA